MATIAQGTDIKPLKGAVIRRVTLGGTVTKGDPISQQTDDAKWDMADGSAAQLTVAVAVQGGVVTDVVDAVVLGPIQCLSGATPGVLVYPSDTEGTFDDGDGATKKTVIGFVESATVLFVLPQIRDFT